MRIVVLETRYRAMLSQDEVLLYMATASAEPDRLPPAQVAVWQKLRADVVAEQTGNGAAWRVNRTEYQAKAG